MKPGSLQFLLPVAASALAFGLRADVANTACMPGGLVSGNQGIWNAQSFVPAVSNDVALPATVFLQSWVMVQPFDAASAALTANRMLAVWDMGASNVVAVSTNAVTWTNGLGQTITPWRMPAPRSSSTTWRRSGPRRRRRVS